MGLSNDLISQFVKSNKETKNNNGNGTLIQGVAKVKSDGSVSVQLGGSKIETPAVATTSVKDGERVLVTIKNHTAYITGTNVASNAGSVIQLTDENGNVINTVHLNTLVADSATIKNRLEASEADIEELQAKSITTDKLEADYIKAKDIEATYLKAAAAESKYAKIDDLDVTNETVHNLDAAYANINQLIFGSAGGDVIQTEFANAVIATLGDAWIKSAMIGDVNTNEVTVKSNDGKLLIKDEVIKISDENRIRVQIGKDGNNDYTINVWNQNGDLIFNSNGITDKAIADGLIRDNMVSDTANISSSKIYLNEEEKTLDIAFKSLSDDVTAKGTAIEANTEAIRTKVWQQDIDDAKDELNTAYSTLEQTVDGINMTVAKHTVQVDENAVNIAAAQTVISQLTDALSTLVTDGNGTSLMTQTEEGWTFSTAEIQNLVNTLSEDLNTLNETVGGTTSTVDILQQAVNDLGTIAEYVKIGTYEDEPCIELGEGDSDFKLRITNTKMVFTEGSTVLAYFNNQAFNVKKVIIQEELQQGGFVWKSRSNGHLSFVWMGGNS